MTQTEESQDLGKCIVCGLKIQRGDPVHYTDLGPAHDGDCFAVWAAGYCSTIYPAEPAREEEEHD